MTRTVETEKDDPHMSPMTGSSWSLEETLATSGQRDTQRGFRDTCEVFMFNVDTAREQGQ